MPGDAQTLQGPAVHFVLASGSASRARVLKAAGLVFSTMIPGVDEDEVKRALLARGATPRAIADALAELKAIKGSLRCPGQLVFGADQTLSLVRGGMLDKPASLAEAREHLRQLSGSRHDLISAVVAARDGQPLWRHVDTARMTMRTLSDAFIDDYLGACGDAILGSVGAYHLEGRGAQLFRQVSGDFFTVLGLPLLPMLQFLRDQGVLSQ